MIFAQKLIAKIQKTHILYIATFFFLLTFIVYGNALGNGLFYDDEDFIYNNAYVKNFSVKEFFTQNAIAGASKISNYYRPLQLLTYGIEQKLFGGSAFVIHLDNILLHIVAVITLFVLLNLILKNKPISLLATVLFAIHPINTEAVTYASGRNDPLAAIFIFLTLITFLKNTKKSKIFSVIFLIFALISRESAIVSPFLLLSIFLFQTESLKKTLEKIPSMLPLFGVILIYILLRLTVLNFNNTLNFYNDNSLYVTNIFVRITTFLSVLPTYITTLIFPKILQYDRVAEVVNSTLNTNVLLSLIVVIIYGIFSIKKFKKQPLFLFSFLWFFIALLPASGIIPINGIIFEHFVYIPAIAFFIVISYLIISFFQKIKSDGLSFVFLLLVIMTFSLLSIRTIQRNQDWHDPITFYTKLLEHNPTIARVHNNLAMALADEGKNDKAIQEYKEAIKLNDIYPQAHYNLANAYVALNKSDDAEKEYQKSLTIDPTLYQSHVSLARLYKATEQKEKFDSVLINVEQLTQKNPNFIPILNYIKSL